MTTTLLPVGSVVKLAKDTEIKYMIAGFYPMNEKTMWEYAAILYPAGLSGRLELTRFNHDQIAEVIFEGYLDENGKDILIKLPNFMQATSDLLGDVLDVMKELPEGDGGENHGNKENDQVVLELE